MHLTSKEFKFSSMRQIATYGGIGIKSCIIMIKWSRSIKFKASSTELLYTNP